MQKAAVVRGLHGVGRRREVGEDPAHGLAGRRRFATGRNEGRRARLSRGRRRGRAAGRDASRQRLARDVAHRDPRVAAVDARRVDRRDAGMFEPRRRLRLAAEARRAHVVRVQKRRAQDLQRDGAVERRVVREVDDRLTAASELAEDPVAADFGRRRGAASVVADRVAPRGVDERGRRGP